MGGHAGVGLFDMNVAQGNIGTQRLRGFQMETADGGDAGYRDAAQICVRVFQTDGNQRRIGFDAQVFQPRVGGKADAGLANLEFQRGTAAAFQYAAHRQGKRLQAGQFAVNGNLAALGERLIQFFGGADGMVCHVGTP